MNDEPDFYINSDEEPAPAAPTPDSPVHDHVLAVETSRKEYMKFFGIILFLAAAGTLMSTLSGFNWEEWMRWFMGGFFIVFGSFKLIGLEMFVIAFRGYDLIAKKYRPYPYVYPFIEIFLGILYILNLLAIPRDIVAIVVMTISAIGVTKAIAHKSHIQCACLGTIIRLPLTTVSLVENLTMGVMALIMLLTTLFT
jgi:hypothetical protein